MRVALIGAFGFATVAQAQITVPTFGTRGSVSDEVVIEFMVSLREALRIDSDIEVRNGDLITPGIAGSLDPDLTILIIAAVEGTRYAVSGEISQSNSTEGAPFMISLIVVDAVQERSSDVLSESFAVSGIAAAAAKLADLIIDFIGAAAGLPAGSAELWVTSLPGEADLLVNGVPVGRTSEIDVLSFQEGRYLVEVRKEGFFAGVSDGRTQGNGDGAAERSADAYRWGEHFGDERSQSQGVPRRRVSRGVSTGSGGYLGRALCEARARRLRNDRPDRTGARLL